MPVEPSHKEKTDICRPSRLYEITRMTDHNEDQIFQLFLHSVLRGLDFCFSFLDDILSASKDEAQHISYLRQVSQRLQDAGHRTDRKTNEANRRFQLHETVKELRRYLVIINFYHRFIPNAAENQSILNEYLKGKKEVTRTEFIGFMKQFKYSKNLKPFIFKDLRSCSLVFVRTDTVRQSLQPPYHGQYQVIKRSDNTFTLLVKNKNVTISIDRLKPCFSDNSSENDIAPDIGKSQADKPAETIAKTIRFAQLPIAPSTRLTRRGNSFP
ncbi:hypothetical protein AVEN_231592-1 [Araneus ventricosus]|uniref:Reverse transcriptase domain-containing protein n=1 Tax=Araneus ventricosus TaxID=182803 RepID=A0A4Y2IJ18_ARAVE|nr:hypothetical protein AVEN_231592-1 [Araneus ventricosus]